MPFVVVAKSKPNQNFLLIGEPQSACCQWQWRCSCLIKWDLNHASLESETTALPTHQLLTNVKFEILLFGWFEFFFADEKFANVFFFLGLAARFTFHPIFAAT